MDFNTLNSTERDFKEQPVLTNIIDLFFSEVEILLTSEPMDVLGNNDFGFDSVKIINQMNASETKVKEELRAAIETYCFTNEFLEDWSIEVKFMQGSNEDIAVIDILATPFDGNEIKKSFLFN